MPPENYNLLRRLLDSVTFLQWFVRIQDPSGLIPWVMDDYQKHLARDFSRQRAINKSKKTGISTTIAGEALHKSYINAGRHIILVSTGQRIAQELLGKYYDEHDSMPPQIQVNFVKRSVEHAELPNGVRIFSLPSADPGAIRGLGMRGTATDVYLDEYAHVPNDAELMVVVRDFQRFGGSLTMNSTPKGKRGKYYELTEPLQVVYRGLGPKTKSEWSYHEIHFTKCPRLVRQEKELREGIDELDFKQEYCAEFIDESVSFFPYEIIWQCQKVDQLISDDYKTNNPIYFGVDFGKKTSETIIFVIEETAIERFKVIYIEVLPGINYADQLAVIKQLNTIFNPSLINIDATGPGGQTMQDLLTREEELSSKVYGYDLMSSFKEKIIIRLRMLMERGSKDNPRMWLPTKACAYGEKLEMQLHSIQRTTTTTGEHTRYSGKAGGGMDDMVWALALACFKEFVISFDPVFVQYSDETLQKLAKMR